MSGEIDRLNAEVQDLQKLRKQMVEQMHQDRIEGRKVPPLSQLTRVQRRYLLEPWFTTIWLACWGIAFACFLASIWVWWLSMALASTGGLFLITGGAAAGAKYWHRDANVRTEGQLLTSTTRRDW